MTHLERWRDNCGLPSGRRGVVHLGYQNGYCADPADTSVVIWGARRPYVPVSFRTFVRTLPEVTWDGVQKV